MLRFGSYAWRVISLATRRVEFIACPPTPDNAWVTQQARNLVMQLGEQDRRFRPLIHDRDRKFTAGFNEVFRSEGIRVICAPIAARARRHRPNGGSEAFGASALTGS